LLAAADMAQARKDWQRARGLLQRGLQQHAKDARFYDALAKVEVLDGKTPEAIACLREGVKALSGQAQADLLWTLGNVFIDQGELKEAEEIVAQLEKANAPAVSYLQARIHFRKDDWYQAARLLERTRGLLEAAPEPNRDLLVQVDLFLGQCYDQLH